MIPVLRRAQFLLAIVMATHGADATSLGTLSRQIGEIALSPVNGLAEVDSEVGSARRWIAWGEGRGTSSQAVRVALFDTHAGHAEPVWSEAWPGAYEPALKSRPEWPYGGHPLMAVTMQFGAAAEQIGLYGLAADGHPVKVAEMLGETVDWTVSAEGKLILEIYSRPGTVLVAQCYGWNETSGSLTGLPCPK